MAIPFGEHYNSEKQESKRNYVQKGNIGREGNLCEGTEERTANCPHTSLASAQDHNASTAIYDTSNLAFCKRVSTSNSASNTENKIQNASSFSKGNLESGRRIKVRKGVFNSHRNITSEDIKLTAEDVKEDWRKLVKKLPGVTNDNLSFHQAFIDAMDRGESTDMAEIALFTWKSALPHLSTVGNLSRTLFSIGHPDVVTHLKP